MDFRTTLSVGLLHPTKECTSCYKVFPGENLFAPTFPQYHCSIVWRTWSGSKRRSKNVVIACAATKSSSGKLSCFSDPLQLRRGTLLQPLSDLPCQQTAQERQPTHSVEPHRVRSDGHYGGRILRVIRQATTSHLPEICDGENSILQTHCG